MPSPGLETQARCNYEDSLTGGQVFTMYCGYCHFPRSLAERPLANYRTAAAHMHVAADLTGKEYDKLMEYLRRWHDVPPPNPPVAPSPTRQFFSQPINELREVKPAPEAAPKARKVAPAEAKPGEVKPGEAKPGPEEEREPAPR